MEESAFGKTILAWLGQCMQKRRDAATLCSSVRVFNLFNTLYQKPLIPSKYGRLAWHSSVEFLYIYIMLRWNMLI